MKDLEDKLLAQAGLAHMANPSHFFKSGRGGPMLKEFKEFAMRGNVLDMAVGLILGAAFGRIVTSFVEDILMPPLGMLLGKMDFSNLFVNLSGKSFETVAAAKAAGAATLNYGMFLNHMTNLVIVTFAIFLLIRQVNRLKRAPAPAEPDTRECPLCCSVIAKRATRCAHCTAQVSAA